MKVNHRRKNPPRSFAYAYLMYRKRVKVGLGAAHDGGRRGAAKDVRELKEHERRAERHAANLATKLEPISD